MRHLKRIFESTENQSSYIRECFLDIIENPFFVVDELVELEQDFFHLPKSSVYKLQLELGIDLSLKAPINSNLYIGMVKTDLEFLRQKNQQINELLNDIEVGIERLQDRYPLAVVEIEANRREEIDLIITLQDPI